MQTRRFFAPREGPSSRSVESCRAVGPRLRGYQPLLGRKRSRDGSSTASSSGRVSRSSQRVVESPQHTHWTQAREEQLLQRIFDGCDQSSELHAMVREGIRYLKGRSAVGYLLGPKSCWTGLQPGSHAGLSCSPTEYLCFALLHNYTLNLKVAYPQTSKQLRLKLLVDRVARLVQDEKLTRAISRTVLSCDLEGCFFDLQQEVGPDTLDSCRRLLQSLATEESERQARTTPSQTRNQHLTPAPRIPQREPWTVSEAIDTTLQLCELLGVVLMHRFEVAVCRTEQPAPQALQATATLKRYSLPSSMPVSLVPGRSKLLLIESRGCLFAFNSIPAPDQEAAEASDLLDRYMSFLDASTQALSAQRINKPAGPAGSRLA